MGIELAPTRVKYAKKVQKKLNKLISSDKNRSVDFLEQDMLDANLSDATAIYIASTCFSDKVMTKLTKKLSHPKYKVPKVYHVTLDKNLNLKDFEKIRTGVTLEDGEVKADSLHYMEDMPKRDVQIEVHSGKNRVIRRIFEHLGYEVVKLDRTYYAGLTKKNLPRGMYRPLTKEEIRMLKHFV